MSSYSLPFPSVLRMPWSGDIVQDIRPEFFSPSYNGVQEIEQDVISEVAGYGRQLGWVSEALAVLIKKAEPFDDPEDAKKIEALKKMVEDVHDLKTRKKADAEGRAASALECLRIIDEEKYRTLLKDKAAKENAAR